MFLDSVTAALKRRAPGAASLEERITRALKTHFQEDPQGKLPRIDLHDGVCRALGVRRTGQIQKQIYRVLESLGWARARTLSGYRFYRLAWRTPV